MMPKKCTLTDKEKLSVILHLECDHYFDEESSAEACMKCSFNNSFYKVTQGLISEGVTFDPGAQFYLKARKNDIPDERI